MWSRLREGKRGHLINWDLVCELKDLEGFSEESCSLREVALELPEGKFGPLVLGYFEHL